MSSKTAGATGETVFTINGVPVKPNELRLICAVLSNLTAPIQADPDAAAAAANLTLGSYKKLWPALRKKIRIDGVSGTVKSAAPMVAADENGEELGTPTPKKTPGGGRGRGRSKKAVNEGAMVVDSGGPSPLTPGVSASNDALAVADDLGTPYTPTKSAFDGGNTKKRTAAEAPEAGEEETPAKKKKAAGSARKPRMTPKQKREAEAAAKAAAEAARLAEVEAESVEFYKNSTDDEPEKQVAGGADAALTEEKAAKIDALLAGEDGWASRSPSTKTESDVFADAAEI